MVNSCLGRFSAAYSRRHPFSRSYGVNLPSSLTTLLPMALGSSPHLPVSVCGTGRTCSRLEAFLAGVKSTTSLLFSIPFTDQTSRCILLPSAPFCLARLYHRPGWFILPCHSCTQSNIRGYRNLHLLSIDYAFRPRLRSRLTPGGRAFPGNP